VRPYRSCDPRPRTILIPRRTRSLERTSRGTSPTDRSRLALARTDATRPASTTRVRHAASFKRRQRPLDGEGGIRTLDGRNRPYRFSRPARASRNVYEISGFGAGGTKKGTACHPLMAVRELFADGQRRTERDRNFWLCLCWHDEREVRSDLRLDRHTHSTPRTGGIQPVVTGPACGDEHVDRRPVCPAILS
jgi:hypothetical protein